jgi:hypothetical protein
MNAMDKFKEEMAFSLFGRSPSVCKAGGQCVKCGEFDLSFSDELSRKEFGISALCQTCQDGIFGVEEEPEVGQGSHAIPGFFVPPAALDGLEGE